MTPREPPYNIPPIPPDEPLTKGGHPRCQGHYKITGRRQRGQGTQCHRRAMPGLTVCYRHGGGGAVEKSRRYEQAELLTRAVRRFGARRDIDPAAALLEVVQQTAGDVAWLRERITDLLGVDPDAGEDISALLWARTRVEVTSDGDTAVDLETGEAAQGPGTTKTVRTLEPHPLWIMLEKSSDRLVKASSAAIAAGIAQMQVELAQQQGLMVAGAIRGVLGSMLGELEDRGMPRELLEAWPALVGQIVPAHLRALSAATDDTISD